MIAASIMNKFGSKQKRLENRLLIMLCVFCFLCGIPLCTQGGIYIFHAIENLNSNWNSFFLSLIQVLVVCHAYGVDKFLEDIADMLRVEKLPSFDLFSSREYFIWRRFLHTIGPTGAYVKWMWSMFAPIVLTILLIASILGYERVTFNGIILPIEYELVAWIVMIGPLLIVPVTALYNIWDARRKNKPLKSVFNGSFRKRELDEEESKQPKHTQQQEDGGLYAYIDPLSRGASAKSGPNHFSRRSGAMLWRNEHQQRSSITTSAYEGQQKYTEFRERLRRWTEEEGSSSIGVQRSLTDRPEIDDDSAEELVDGNDDHRMPGRISEWQCEYEQQLSKAPQVVAMSASSSTATALDYPHFESKVAHSSVTDTQSQSKCDSPFLFGPPPQQAVSLAERHSLDKKVCVDNCNEEITSNSINITVTGQPDEDRIGTTVIELNEFASNSLGGASSSCVVPCSQYRHLPSQFSLTMHHLQSNSRPTTRLTRQRLKRPQPIAVMKK